MTSEQSLPAVQNESPIGDEDNRFVINLSSDTTCSAENSDSSGSPDKVGGLFDSANGTSTSSGSNGLIEDASVTVVFAAQKYAVKISLDEPVVAFKSKLENLTRVPADMQKLICKGVKLVEGKTLRECKVENASRIMLIGSRLNDILNASELPTASSLKENTSQGQPSKEPLCRQKQHLKVLEKGIPDDVMPGIRDESDPLPDFPIMGMLNKHGGKVRLTFKLESDQVWIGTKERTDKIAMNQIRSVISEPIEYHEEYHIMALQLGPTEQSRYFLYWVPAQYISAIKNAVMGP